MEELINAYHSVTSFDASCRMTTEQQREFSSLNRLYNQETGSRNRYSICNKQSLIKKVELYLAQNGYTTN